MKEDKIKLAREKLIEAEKKKKEQERLAKLEKEREEKLLKELEKQEKEKPRLDFESKIQHYIENLEELLIEKANKGETLKIDLLTICECSYDVEGGSISSYEYEEPTVSRVYDPYDREYKTYTHMKKRREFNDTTYSLAKKMYVILDEYNPFNIVEADNFLEEQMLYYYTIKKYIKNNYLKKLVEIIAKKNIYPNFIVVNEGSCYCEPKYNKYSERISNIVRKQKKVVLEIDARISFEEKNKEEEEKIKITEEEKIKMGLLEIPCQLR